MTDAPDESPVVEIRADEALPSATANIPLKADASAAPDEARASAVRNFFHSRRSAKLPRITPTGSTDPENTPEYEAV